MAVSQPATSLGSSVSAPIFSGDLAACSIVDDFFSGLETLWPTVTSEAAEFATSALKDAAHNDVLWAKYEESVHVEYTPDGFLYIITGTDQDLQAMRELEHGGPEVSPHPVIRTSAINHAAQISKHLKLTIPL